MATQMLYTFTAYILWGLHGGFCIECHPEHCLRSAPSNLPSSAQNPSPVSDYLSKESEVHCIIGPLPIELEAQYRIHVSRLGVIPKQNQLEKWQLVLNMLSPHSTSVN